MNESLDFTIPGNIPFRSGTVYRRMIEIIDLPGDIIELGVWAGPTTLAMARYLKDYDIDKKIYACDTFEGLPHDGHKWEPDLAKGDSAVSQDVFWENITKAKLEDYVITVKGKVEDTLADVIKGKRFCFAVLDMDLYAPTSFAVRLLQDKVVVGGAMGFHDYGYRECPGIKIVVDKEIDQERYERYSNIESNYAWVKRIAKPIKLA